MMISGIGSLRTLRLPAGLLLLLAIAGAGCSTANTSTSGGGGGGSVAHVASPGTDVPGWFVLPTGGSHGSAATLNFIANDGVSSCEECHGADLTGGISKVSCFANPAGCHHGPIQNFAGGAVHGPIAKKAPGNSGFASCQICHGAGFSGGGSGISCFTSNCHNVSAPHPVKPWRSSSGGSTHTTTDPQNALVCARCHAQGSSNNPAGHPATPAPAGTAPGCYNNTLCHGVGTVPHAIGDAWVQATSGAFHGVTAKQNLAYCQGCHGTPGTTLFDGGAATTSCQSSSGCHPQAKAHPTRWYQAAQPFPGYVSSHRNAGDLGVSCAICHKVDGAGTGLDNAAPSCYSGAYNGVSCHSGGPGGPNHAVPFTGSTHTGATQAAFDGNCAPCHAVSGASPLSSAPLCTVCHKSATALPFANCASCHAKPPSGTVYPNIAGTHGKHDALAGVTGVCTACHNNLDSGTLGHYNRANAAPGKDALRVSPGDAAFLSVYNAKAGAASFDNVALTCANVSCHGAVVTPNWRTAGSIGVNTNAGCVACHKPGTAAGSPENNSPYSGLHSSHLDPAGVVKATCVECHNMANGTTGAANHFKFLNTPAMEGPASQTVEVGGSASNYNAVNQTCTVNCHSVQHTAFSWQGGANHAVPFLATGHTTVAQAGFDANCAPCHAVAGTSPTSAPLCTVCHASATALPFTNCASCHAKPPAGSAYPNIAGRHAKHDALATVTGVCGVCHSGLDTGSLPHYNRANARPGRNALRIPPGDAAFQSTFNAKAGAASFDNSALTCANVSCHGAVAAPNWQTGTIGSTTDAGCRLCHKPGTALGTPENNSPFSGMHGFHLSASGTVVALCTDCHDMNVATNNKAGVTNHFKFLNTPQMEGPASDTLAAAVSYNVTNQTCTVTCHSHAHTNSSWAGGANHAAPFLATAHTAVNQAGFTGNCATCHAVSGTSPFSLAPTCVTCHTAGSPLTMLNCTSCHANPPVGTAYPDIAGKHAKHNALATVTGVCGACHSGLNTGSQAHYDRANARPGKNALRVAPGDVAMVSTFNAKTGAASFDNAAFTCAKVSCHGGQTAPSWRTGTITVNTQCASCHVYGTTQYNGPTSSNHNRSQHSSQACTVCHNTTALAVNHFTKLNTQALEGPASATVGGTTGIAAGNYAATTKSCTPTCHGRQTW